MRCRHSLSFVFVAFSVFFSGLFFTTQNSFAVSDIVYIMSSNERHVFCGSDSGVSCSDYSYFIVENTGSTSGFSSFTGPIINNSFYLGGLLYGSYVYHFDNNLSSIAVTGLTGMSAVPSFEFTFTLTDSLPENCSSLPSGDISITSNGTYDVSSYATASVDVPAEVIQGDYHDDLVSIQKSIIVCGAILLVLYFFYCIYRLIIKNSGVH